MAKKKLAYSEQELTQPLQPPSLLKSVGSGVVSGLSAIGNTLDLPGSSVRDLLAGKNPADQWLTPFSSENRTSGRDLLRQHGLIGRKDTYGNFFGGLAAEVALDPLLPFSFGKAAVGNAGKLVQKAGLFHDIGRVASRAAGKAPGAIGMREARLGTTIRDILAHGGPEAQRSLDLAAQANKVNLADLLDEPLGGLAKFWPTGTVLGTGQTARKVARGLDLAGNAIRFGKIPGTSVRPVADIWNQFDAGAMNATSPATLETARHAKHVKEANRARVGLEKARLANELKAAGYEDDKLKHVLRNWMEIMTNAPPELQPFVKEVQDWISPLPQLAKELGVKLGDANLKIKWAGGKGSFVNRSLAEGLEKVGGGLGRGTKPLSGSTTSGLSRAFDWSWGSQKGTQLVTAMGDYVDELERLGITKIDDIAVELEAKFGGQMPSYYLDDAQIDDWLKNFGKKHGDPTLANAATLTAANPAMVDRFTPKDAWLAAAKDLSGLTPEARAVGIFANHPLMDVAKKTLSTTDAIESARAALDHIVNLFKGGGHAKSGKDTKTLRQLLDVDKGINLTVGDHTGGAVKYIMDQLGWQPATIKDFNLMKATILDGLHVDADTAKFLTQMIDGWESPENLHGLLGLYDRFTNLTKGMFTSVNPKFHVRNRISGLVANVLDGADATAAGASRDVDRLIRGQVIEGASQNAFLKEIAAQRGIPNLDDRQATDILAELMHAHEITGSYGVHTGVTQGTKQPGSSIQEIFHDIPGAEPFTEKQVVDKLLGRKGSGGTWSLREGKVRGVHEGADKSTLAPFAAGDDLGYYVESMNRGSAFWALLQNGTSPAEAARRVLESQVGYQNRFFTKTEQQLIQRLIPFYKFSKGMLPFTLRMLVENPGGRLAQTLRAINQFKDEDELVPAHVAETASIPLGTQPDGSKRYLTGLGLGFEDPAQFAQPSLQNAMLEGMSRLNPLLKAPLEIATGQSFFQRGPGGGGRSLEDLDPVLGRTLSNIGQLTGLQGMDNKRPIRFPGSDTVEHVLSNSPLSTLLTTARTATDPRKGLLAKSANLLTGFKLTDVSPAAQDRELLNRASAIEKQLLGARSFTTSYIPKDKKGEMSPKEQELEAQIAALRRLVAERRKARD